LLGDPDGVLEMLAGCLRWAVVASLDGGLEGGFEGSGQALLERL